MLILASMPDFRFLVFFLGGASIPQNDQAGTEMIQLGQPRGNFKERSELIVGTLTYNINCQGTLEEP